MQDMARELGVSTATVSRALNGHPHVNEETRRRVVEGAARMGYQPNVLARALRQEHSRLVGLIVPDVRSDFFAVATSVLQDVLTEHGYRLILGVSGDRPDVDRDYVSTMLQHRVEGIVHVPCTDDGAEPYLRTARDAPPVVEFLRHSRVRHCDTVVSDEERGAGELAHHVIDLGHRRLAVIAGPERFSTTRDRAGGFVKAAADAGLEVQVLHGEYAHDWGREAMGRLLAQDERPTAVFAAGNQLVSGALQTAAEEGIDLPGELSLVGADDPDWYKSCRPAVTTFAAPLEQMGMVTAQTLLGRMRSDPKAAVGPVDCRLAGRLTVRESCALPPGA